MNNQLKAALDKEVKRILSEADQVIEEEVKQMVMDVKTAAPVKSGRLRNSIKSEKLGQLHHRIYSDVDYAIFVEHGTSDTRPQPFFFPTINQGILRLAEKLKRIVGE